MSTTNTQSSPALSPTASPAFHAPRANVKALLDQLSDSEDELVVPTRRVRDEDEPRSKSVDRDVESSEDEVVLGGRLAARLAGDTCADDNTVAASDGNSRTSSPQSDKPAGPARKLLLKRKRAVEDEASPPGSSPKRFELDATKAASPTPQQSEQPSSSPQQTGAAKPKFLALVEKIRAERLAREAEEKAKVDARKERAMQAQVKEIVAASRPRGQRGSSPADDSEEDSNASEGAAAKKLTKGARPTRKASKKALEEMHRETQRMNRNMQLAHQAKTKKKFTKEEFFAKFNKLEMPVVPEVKELSSSTVGSDAEPEMLHSTPPTSPLSGPDTAAKVVDTHTNEAEDIANESEEDFLSFVRSRRQEDVKNEGLPTKPAQISNVRFQLSRAAILKNDSDSDSDVEIVFDKGEKRKYAAFENIPKKKAQENAAHLALRSLAQIKREKDKKSTMTSVGMSNSLMKAAREQALAERKAKIEKLRAAGVVIQTEEEREQAEEELEDLVEKARLEDEEIRKREKQLAKKQGTYVKDVDEESDDDDSDFADDHQSGSEEEAEASADEDEDVEIENALIDEAAEETGGSEEEEAEDIDMPMPSRPSRIPKVVVDEDDDEPALPISTVIVPQSPTLPSATKKTPQSIMRSTRKVIPGLEYSDDLDIGLTQAFAATMADTQDDTTQEDSLRIIEDLPSPNIAMAPRLDRVESFDLIAESVVGTQLRTQPLGLDLGLPQSQVPQSQPFVPTQDAGYRYSPFIGSRFADSPNPQSTIDTVILPHEESPVLRRGRLQRIQHDESDGDDEQEPDKSVFKIMKKAAKRNLVNEFNKKNSEARKAFDEDAEESDDEYAGLGGASDDESGEENEDDRKMIDEDTQVGQGDEAALAKLHADRERAQDEQAVNKLYKDITTGALRRKRGGGDDLDLSDEEDAAARRREAKRREYNKMRKELFKDEAVNKIAEDQRKQAFLKSIEDRDDEEDDDDFDREETQPEESQSQSQDQPSLDNDSQRSNVPRPLRETNLNVRRVTSRKPTNIAEIRESVSFLIEDTQSQQLDLGLSDDEGSYVNLDRHLDADEENDDGGMADFIVDDIPVRAPYNERRTKPVVDRMSLLQQKSSSASGRMAFLPRSGSSSFLHKTTLIRSATNASATGVVTAERGRASQDRVVARKASDTAKNSINWTGRKNLSEEKMSKRAGIVKKQKKVGGGFLKGLFAGSSGFD